MYNPHGGRYYKFIAVRQSGMRCYFSPTLFYFASGNSRRDPWFVRRDIIERFSPWWQNFQVKWWPLIPYACDKDHKRQCRFSAWVDLKLHIHVAENLNENKINFLRNYGRPLAFLGKVWATWNNPAIFCPWGWAEFVRDCRFSESPVSIAYNLSVILSWLLGVSWWPHLTSCWCDCWLGNRLCRF